MAPIIERVSRCRQKRFPSLRRLWLPALLPLWVILLLNHHAPSRMTVILAQGPRTRESSPLPSAGVTASASKANIGQSISLTEGGAQESGLQEPEDAGSGRVRSQAGAARCLR